MIDIAELRASRTGAKTVNILPAIEDEDYELAEEHKAEPIKSLETINRISTYLKDSSRYRDNMLFILGINFGLRISDILTLKFSRLINPDMTFKDTFAILEKKTKNTRKVRQNRYITINSAVRDAVTLYLENTSGVRLSDFMFRSESNNGKDVNRPLARQSPDNILKGIARDLHLNEKIATHTLRKTFAYHQMLMSGNDSRKLLLLQKMFGHSSSMQTLTYIGITSEEISKAYSELNLGSEDVYLVNSNLFETSEKVS
ncbi:MAG: tyrosine-type recombinase/integrase [Bacteroides sp.]